MDREHFFELRWIFLSPFLNIALVSPEWIYVLFNISSEEVFWFVICQYFRVSFFVFFTIKKKNIILVKIDILINKKKCAYLFIFIWFLYFFPFFVNIFEHGTLQMQIYNYENHVWISYSIPLHENLSKLIENKKIFYRLKFHLINQSIRAALIIESKSTLYIRNEEKRPMKLILYHLKLICSSLLAFPSIALASGDYLK